MSHETVLKEIEEVITELRRRADIIRQLLNEKMQPHVRFYARRQLVSTVTIMAALELAKNNDCMERLVYLFFAAQELSRIFYDLYARIVAIEPRVEEQYVMPGTGALRRIAETARKLGKEYGLEPHEFERVEEEVERR